MTSSPGSLGMSVALVSLVGIVAFGLYWVLQRALELLPLGQDRRQRLRRVLPTVGFLGSLVFALLASSVVFSPYPAVVPFVYLSVFLLYGALAFRWLRDVIAGIAMRAEGACEVGDHLQVGAAQGRVVELGLRAMSIEGPHGDRIVIPYGQAAEHALVRSRSEDVGAAGTFVLQIPEHQEFADFAKTVRKTALSCHWSSIVKLPQVRRLEAGRAEVSIFALDADRLADIEDQVRAAFSGASDIR